MQTPTTEVASLDKTDAPIGGRVVTGIREAAARTGVSFNYLLAQATQESGLDPHASNTKSTASGLFQFTAPTWLEMIRRHGAAHGLGAEAAAIAKGADGRLDVADKAAKKAILDLRKDPRLSSMMAAEYARDNATVLEKRLGRPASSSDLYLAHFLGAGGAARVIEGMEDNPRHSAQRLLPEAARANPEVFREPGSRKARTVAGLYKSVQARFKEALGADAMTSVGRTPPPVAGRADLAALRPLPRPEADAPATAIAAAVTTKPAAPAASQAAAIDAYTARSFASAIQPESPFFPAAIPSSPTLIPSENLTLRDIVEAVKAGKDV